MAMPRGCLELEPETRTAQVVLPLTKGPDPVLYPPRHRSPGGRQLGVSGVRSSWSELQGAHVGLLKTAQAILPSP